MDEDIIGNRVNPATVNVSDRCKDIDADVQSSRMHLHIVANGERAFLQIRNFRYTREVRDLASQAEIGFFGNCLRDLRANAFLIFRRGRKHRLDSAGRKLEQLPATNKARMETAYRPADGTVT